MHAVSYTAQWTAAIRALEAEQVADRLFLDELAEPLAQPKGFELLERYNGGGVKEFVAIRTHYNDAAIARNLTDGRIKQIVLVAAGMDTRAFRLDWPEGVRIFEVDHQLLLDEKHKRLTRLEAKAKASRTEVPADLSKPWIDRLIAHGFDPVAGTLWVAEGLLFFLDEGEATNLLQTMAKASAPGSRLITDMINGTLLKSPMAMMFLATLRADGTPWRFGSDEPEVFLHRCGWKALEVCEPAETEAGKRRWPYAHQNRTIKGIPRNWLIQAEVAG